MWDIWKVPCLFSQIELNNQKLCFPRPWKPVACANDCVGFEPVSSLHVVSMNWSCDTSWTSGAEGITGKEGRTPGVVPGRNNHWMQLAAQSQLGPDSSVQRHRGSVSDTFLQNDPLWVMPHIKRSSFFTEREGSESAPSEERDWCRCRARGPCPNSNERQLWARREWSLYSNKPQARDENRISIYERIQREWNSRRFMTYSNL